MDIKPNTYLFWSVVLGVVLCPPTGLLAVMYGLKVDDKWNAHDPKGALRASRWALFFLWVSVVVGVTFATWLNVLGASHF